MPRNPESCQILPVTTTSRCFDEISVTHRTLPFLAPLRGGKTRAGGAALPGDIRGVRTHGAKRQFPLPVVDTRMRYVVRCHAAPRFKPGALPYPCIASSVKSITADSAVPLPTPVPLPRRFTRRAGSPAHGSCPSPTRLPPCRAVGTRCPEKATPPPETAPAAAGPWASRIGRPTRGAAGRSGRTTKFRCGARGGGGVARPTSGPPACPASTEHSGRSQHSGCRKP